MRLCTPFYAKVVIRLNCEAVNGSNISVVMKTSLFEVVKNNFLTVLLDDKDVEKAEVTRTAKAKKASSIPVYGWVAGWITLLILQTQPTSELEFGACAELGNNMCVW